MQRCWNISVVLLSFALLAGCATKRVDWAARVGNYTYDQAVIELGPPDKQTTLSDGSVVADWITHRSGSGASFGIGTGMSSGGGGVGVGVSRSVGSSQDRGLRLTFKNGQLENWSRH